MTAVDLRRCPECGDAAAVTRFDGVDSISGG
jgi:hypothetical protein